MGWQTFHKWLGWDFAHLRNTATEIVRRVHRTRSGERYVVYFQSHLVFIDRPECGWIVTDLTAPREMTIVSARTLEAP